jgi:hypothetical protein
VTTTSGEWQVTPTEQPQADASMSDDELEAGIDALDEQGFAEAKKMRAELAKRKDAARELAEMKERYGQFDGLHPDDVAALAAFTDALRSDPAEAAQMALRFSKGLADTAQVDLGDLIPDDWFSDSGDGDDDGDDVEGHDMAGLSEADIRRIVQEQWEQQQEFESARAELLREVESLGYKPDASDPKTHVLLSLATRFDGDLNAAHTALIEQVIEAKSDDKASVKASDDADGAPDGDSGQDRTSMLVAPDGVPASGANGEPRTAAEAEASAMARLDALVD